MSRLRLSRGYMKRTQAHPAEEVRPDCPSAYLQAAIVALERGRPDEAVSSLRNAITLRPDYQQAFRLLALAFLRLGRVSEAIEGGRRAVDLDVKDPFARVTLSNALRKARRLRE